MTHSEVGGLNSAGVRVLLAGAGSFAPGSGLHDLPSVAGSLDAVRDTLIRCCGVRPQSIDETVLNPGTPLEISRALRANAEAATDVLLFYYCGHGLIGTHDALHLATSGTTQTRDGVLAEETALPYSTVRAILAEGGAATTVVILDCCFAERAGGSTDAALADLWSGGQPGGGFLLAAAASDQFARAPVGAPYTALAGELIRLLSGQDEENGPRAFTLEYVYRRLQQTMPALPGAPVPRRQLSGTAGDLALAPNPRYRPPALPVRTQPAGLDASDALCPYPGMAPFQSTDAGRFFGRERLVEQLLDQLASLSATQGPVLVFGSSGSGKSSLLRAGLIPALGRGLPGIASSAHWPRLLLTPGSDPLGALAQRFTRHTDLGREAFLERARTDPQSLAKAARALTAKVQGDAAAGQSVVLVVDQFEEVFASHVDEADREAFIRLLVTATQPDDGGTPAAVVLLGIRADFYGYCQRDDLLGRAVAERRTFDVTPMTEDELHAAITKPAEAAGVHLEPGLADRLLRELTAPGHATTGSGDGAPAPDTRLPLLSHVLRETWKNHDGAWLTRADYEKTGTIWSAVARTAERVWDACDAAEQEIAKQLLLRLVYAGSSGTAMARRAVPLADLRPGALRESDAATATVLDKLADARLITIGQDTAELAHEALVHTWHALA